jgi:EAL domain-containing protein (putative c-di-GMP-specific phosphodiesterase class I)
MHIDTERLHLTMSAGIVSNAHGGADDLPQLASQALRKAKQAGQDRETCFDASLRPVATDGILLARELRRGIESDQLRLHYQPIVEVASNRLTGFEALVRWQHPELGLLAPAQFIELAERTNQITALGAWVTGQACRTLMDVGPLAAGLPSMSINISARQLDDDSIVELLQQAMQSAGCPPKSVTVEVTETALMRDLTAAVHALQRIKELGVGLSLDDFGTGYSSLLYLKHFPVDLIKIDKSFVRGLGTEADDTAIVASTVSLAHSIGVRCVAEGVETFDQLDLLRRLGCDYAQGYLFSRPLPRPQLDQWLRAHSPVSPDAKTDAAPNSAASSEVMRLHHEGASLHTIAAALNKQGLRTDRGVRWSAKSVATAITVSQFPDIILPRE